MPQTFNNTTRPSVQATSSQLSTINASNSQVQTQAIVASSSATEQEQQNNELNDQDEYMCPICRDILTAAFVTPCGHSYCYTCINHHLKRQHDCPMCRGPLETHQIYPNINLNKLIERLGKALPGNSTNSKATRQCMDSLPDSTDTQSLSRTLVERAQLKTQEDNIKSALLSYFLVQTELYSHQAIEKLNKRLDLIYHDLDSIGFYQYKNTLPRRIYSESTNIGTILENDRHCGPVISGNDSDHSDNDDNNDNESGKGDNNDSDNETEDTTQPSDISTDPTITNTRKRKATVGIDTRTLPEKFQKRNDETTEALDLLLKARKNRIKHHFTDLMDLYFIGRKDKKQELSSFSSTLYKMTCYGQFKSLDTIQYTDISSNASIVSSIELDRDENFVAIGGVSKEIKLYDFNSFNERIDGQNDDNDDDEAATQCNLSNRDGYIGRQSSRFGLVHCPLRVIPCMNKISCLSWNPYIQSLIASSDYEGTVRLWDTTTGQCIRTFEEHRRRAWSVDTCAKNPTMLASGSDDATVKIWSTQSNQSVLTLQQRGNICCAKFAPNNIHHIALGSADHHITCYDLRRPTMPFHIFAGHQKAVSYVKWRNDNELISLSTDNTLKAWETGKNECTRTYSGHQNEKNFVGLSLKDELISCGSENNTLYTYHKDSSQPVAKYNFPLVDPITGQETYCEDASLFVSSVCWKSDSMKVLVGNSKGIVKVLQLVE
ncbi:WD40-repeat-containing domain protein [Halteromyces radiatus]|uniref:WD40-repeat-containing domain protein n=1 Tax=Halteromyces radiatus TaxID=101107 RepID=UPI0022207BB7|nr:WD40-repeat-containing domain protein [Halteromyces radiatus]KAI8084941.1 WD40-repeat-containing domain protein [Halteromyces radiatus]